MDSERGSATAEVIFVTAAIMLVLLFGVAAGRVVVATFAVETAARDAARQASIARTAAARTKAVASATATCTVPLTDLAFPGLPGVASFGKRASPVPSILTAAELSGSPMPNPAEVVAGA